MSTRAKQENSEGRTRLRITRRAWWVLAAFGVVAGATFVGDWAEVFWVSRPFHIPYIVALSGACGYAAVGMWSRFRLDHSGQSFLLAASFAGLGMVFLPHSLYAGDVEHAFFSPASRFVFGAFLVMAMANVRVPRMLDRPLVAVALTALAFVAIVDLAAHGDWVRRLLGTEPADALHFLELGALWLEIVALVVIAVRWSRNPSSLMATIGAMVVAMMIGGVMAFFSLGWQVRWWISHFYLFTASVILVMGIARQLSRAIAENELLAYFQPKVHLATGTLAGAEVLVRWNHPERGIVPPGEFIELAEQTELIRPLTIWVLRTALHQHVAWAKEGLKVPIAVNLSTRLLGDPRLPGIIGEELEHHGIDHALLELELTETGFMENREKGVSVFGALRSLGIRLAIDDYGTGYSSLAYLKTIPVDEIKIDKSFVQNMDTDQSDLIIVRSTVELTHNLGREVVAEGVETAEVRDLLVSVGCEVGQGYFWSPPLPPDAFEVWVNGFHADTASKAALTKDPRPS